MSAAGRGWQFAGVASPVSLPRDSGLARRSGCGERGGGDRGTGKGGWPVLQPCRGGFPRRRAGAEPLPSSTGTRSCSPKLFCLFVVLVLVCLFWFFKPRKCLINNAVSEKGGNLRPQLQPCSGVHGPRVSTCTGVPGPRVCPRRGFGCRGGPGGAGAAQ